ncbi:MAG: hypothetical protein U0871_19425 [Gemmataceae bacterium]
MNIGNRGIVEFIEVLKLDVAFRYVLGASQEQDQAEEVRPDGHRRGDPRAHQRAGVPPAAEQRVHGGGKDRTVKIDIPYVTRLRDEVKIYEKDYSAAKVKGKHIAPHTVEVAAMWAVLTRLSPPKHAG